MKTSLGATNAVVLMFGLLLVTVMNQQQDASAQEDFETYTNEDYQFSIGYPEDWEVREYNLQPTEVVNFVTTFDVGDPAIVQVYMLDLKTTPQNANATLKELVDRGIETQKATAKQISRTNTTIAGLPAEEKILYQYDYGSVKALEAITLTPNDELIAIHYVTEPEFFDEFLPTVKQIINSFELS